MKTIRLYKDEAQRAWMAQSSDPEVMELFGTDTLPTPFLTCMPGHEVQAQLASLNPDACVIVQE